MKLGSERTDRLVAEIDALPPLSGEDTVHSCFFYIDPIIELHLAYPGGRAVSIWLSLGCPDVSNGDIGAATGNAAYDRVERTLLHLTRPRHQRRRS